MIKGIERSIYSLGWVSHEAANCGCNLITPPCDETVTGNHRFSISVHAESYVIEKRSLVCEYSVPDWYRASDAGWISENCKSRQN